MLVVLLLLGTIVVLVVIIVVILLVPDAGLLFMMPFLGKKPTLSISIKDIHFDGKQKKRSFGRFFQRTVCCQN